jgi:hypothetical protein
MKKILVSCLLFTFSTLLFAQTALEIEMLLETSVVTGEQAASFVMRAADIDGAENPANAFRHAKDNRWLRRATDLGGIRLDEASLLIMQSFGIRGGLFYSLFKSPNYAYRELVYKEVIQGRADPAMIVSGDQLLFMINRVFYLFEDDPRMEQ